MGEIGSDDAQTGMNVLKASSQRDKEDLGGFEEGLKLLLEKFRKVHGYTGALMAKNEPVPPKFQAAVREFSRVLRSAEPVFAVDQFESLCSSTLQDTLMCVYLAQLARTQSVLAEKTNSVTTAMALDDF